MALRKNAPAPEEENNRAVAFVNWAIPTGDGKFIRASKGFPIFQNPRYPNRHEDMLVNLAKKYGGTVEVMMKCRVIINQAMDPNEINLDNIAVLPPEATAAP